MDEKAESPLEIILTVMVTLILFVGFFFAMSPIVDGFIWILSKVPIQLSANFQTDMVALMTLNQIFYAVPSFVGAVLVIWGIKSVYRKKVYSTQQDTFNMEYQNF